MASFFDLKGTSLQYFYIGLKKLKFDSSALTQERIFYLPDATVTMTGGSVGEVLGITGANAIGWVSITPPPALINVEQNGTLILSTNTLNFTGAGVVVTQNGADVDIAISGGGGGGGSYADVNISALDIDWSLGTTYYKDISANSTFTFSNIVEGKTITVILTSVSAQYTANFPSTKQAPGGLDNNVYSNSSTVYTFTRSNGITYVSSFSGVI